MHPETQEYKNSQGSSLKRFHSSVSLVLQAKNEKKSLQRRLSTSLSPQKSKQTIINKQSAGISWWKTKK
jgi:hypothetical protein